MKTIIKSPFKSYFLITAQVMIMFMLTSCSKSSDMTGSGNQNPPPPVTKGANEVFIIDMAFSPSSLSVSAGTTVKWTNQDAVVHTVTSVPAGLFDSGSIPKGGTFSYTFSTAGTYNYYCAIHPSMLGVVIVQ
jgi:plastocyanin